MRKPLSHSLVCFLLARSSSVQPESGVLSEGPRDSYFSFFVFRGQASVLRAPECSPRTQTLAKIQQVSPNFRTEECVLQSAAQGLVSASVAVWLASCLAWPRVQRVFLRAGFAASA